MRYALIIEYVNSNGVYFLIFYIKGKLWMTGALYGKFAGVFFSTGSQASGQETTALSCLPCK
jgi:hypothetical protein